MSVDVSQIQTSFNIDMPDSSAPCLFFSLALMLKFNIFKKKNVCFLGFGLDARTCDLCAIKKTAPLQHEGPCPWYYKIPSLLDTQDCVQFNTQPNPPFYSFLKPKCQKWCGSALNSCVRVEILCQVILWKVFLIYSVLNEKDRPASDRGTDNLTT